MYEISSDEYFMGLAFLASPGSNGSIISNSSRILSIGVEGSPFFLKIEKVVCHSEKNALLNSTEDLHGAHLFVTNYPCSRCVLDIIAAGIKRLVYYPLKFRDDWDKVLELAKITNFQVEEFKGNLNWVRDRVRVLREDLDIF